MLLTAVLIAVSLQAAQPQTEDPALRAAVERFFATQEAEDVEGYLALWSRTATPPRVESLKYIFESGDDKFTDIRIVAAKPSGDRLRARVAVRRQRTTIPTSGAMAIARTTEMVVGLTYLREGGDWKLLREGPAHDDLAAALVDAPSKEEREKLLAAEPEMVASQSRRRRRRERGRHPAGLCARRASTSSRSTSPCASATPGWKARRSEPRQRVLLPAQAPGGACGLRAALTPECSRGNDEGMASALVGVG